MAKFKIDGDKFKSGSKVLANFYDEKIYAGSTRSKCLANMDNNRLYDGNIKSNGLINVKGDYVYEGKTASKKLAKMKDIQKLIEGQGDLQVASLWYLFIR
jgi:hypothetical protein